MGGARQFLLSGDDDDGTLAMVGIATGLATACRLIHYLTLLLGHGFGKRTPAGREDGVGQTLRLNQENHIIAGVLPSEERVWLEADYWLPLACDI